MEANMQENKEYKYDVAISYESHNCKFVREVVRYLESEKYEIFFDQERRMELLSEDIKGKLYQIYQKESLIKVLFITEKYLQSEYTMLESRRSFSGAEDNKRKVIVINCMGDKLPEPYTSYGYLSSDMPADEIANLISRRVEELKEEKVISEENTKRKMTIGNLNVIEKNEGIVTGDHAHINL